MATADTDAVFVSVDIDVLDIATAPGTAAPSPAGLDSGDIVKAMFQLGAAEQTIGMDLVEVSPPHDIKNVTTRTAVIILLHFLGGLASRSP